MTRTPDCPILEPGDVKPSKEWLKVEGIFNCGAVKYKDEYILLCRVAESCIKKDEVDRVPIYDYKNDQLKAVPIQGGLGVYDISDPRVICTHSRTGKKRVKYLTSISHLRLGRSKDGTHFQLDDKPALGLSGKYEQWGMEDPRITYLEDEGRYCITYAAVSEKGVLPSLLLTENFIEYQRIEAIFPPENKDVVIFPKKINGYYYALHRPVPGEIGMPDIWIASSPDLIHWGQNCYVYGTSLSGWESGRVGSGAPPIYTDKGWLHIYHGADSENRYCLGAFLTDLQEPGKILARTRKPLLEPEKDYERQGFLGGVVFTCGCIQESTDIYIYYGASDDKIARALITLDEIFASLK